MEVSVVLITASSGKQARAIADKLIKEELAACVKIFPKVRSVYTWKGRTESALEHVLMAETRTSLFGRLEKTVKKMHSYECPEIIALPLSKGSRDYVKWVEDSTCGMER